MPACDVDAPRDTRVLVVDDETANRSLLRRFLRSEGFEVREAASVAEAADLLERTRLDLALLDLRMPGEDGIDALRRIRTSPEHRDLPVIITTSETDPDWTVRCLELGADDFVTKPLDLRVLRSRIHAALRRARAARPPEAKLFDGRFELLESLGEGAFGAVHAARDRVTGRVVALKRFPPRIEGSVAAMGSFDREACCVCRLEHPNVPRPVAFGVAPDGTVYLATERVLGPSLRDLLAERGALPVERGPELLAPIADALAEAHRSGFVHRDVKPSHVLLESTTDGVVPKLIDFGIAALLRSRELWSVDGEEPVFGSPPYMAPEVLCGHEATGRSDVYALGAILLEMLTGEPPFRAPRDMDPHELVERQIDFRPPRLRDLGPATATLDGLVREAMHPVATRRPDAASFATELRAAAVRNGGGDDPGRDEEGTLLLPSRP